MFDKKQTNNFMTYEVYVIGETYEMVIAETYTEALAHDIVKCLKSSHHADLSLNYRRKVMT